MLGSVLVRAKTAIETASDAELAKVLKDMINACEVDDRKVVRRIYGLREETARQANRQAKIAEFTPEQAEALITTLKTRFEANMERHPEIDWAKVEAKLRANPEKVWELNEREEMGGEPDVTSYEASTDEYIFDDRYGRYIHSFHRNRIDITSDDYSRAWYCAKPPLKV